jgi:DNA-binding HxlR family transcriptional regulator
MLPRTYPEENCSIARSLEILGDRWTLLVLRDALRGISRFDALQAGLGLAKNVLADRLERLVGAGILDRRLYQQRPDRSEYLVTEKGRALWPVLVAMMDWGDRYCSPLGPPRIAVHETCGGTLHAELVCDGCDLDIEAIHVSTRAGPGARRRSP